MTSVSPFVVLPDTVVDYDDSKKSEPGLLFVKRNGKTFEDVAAVDTEMAPKRKMTIEQGLLPLLASMKVVGLYFDRSPQDNPDKKPRKWSAYKIYAVAIVVLLWFNFARMFSMFTRHDAFGLPLLNKVIMVAWSAQCTVSQTAFYAASFSGRLAIVFRQELEDKCANHARKFSTFLAITSWSIIAMGFMFFLYTVFFTEGLMDSIIAPFQNYIIIADPLIPRIIAMIIMVYLLSSYIFSQAVTFVLAMIFSTQFRRVSDNLGRCLDNPQRHISDSDIEMLRQKHQEISMTVDHVDDSLMFSNASAFCCQVFCFIIVLYTVLFYHSYMIDTVVVVSYVFWIFTLSFGLLLTAASGIMVHHYVSHFIVFVLISICMLSTIGYLLKIIVEFHSNV